MYPPALPRLELVPVISRKPDYVIGAQAPGACRLGRYVRRTLLRFLRVAHNYGQAGAIDFLGPRHGLPKAICNHNSYWSWGPRDCTGAVLLVIGGDRHSLEERFSSLEIGTTYACDDCMPYENNKPIWIPRGAHGPLKELWPKLQHFE